MNGAEGWQEVGRKRRRIRRGEFREEWTTFFFRNFPEECCIEVLRRRFEEIGRVMDLFVPRRKDKLGFRFGFARFLRRWGVKDEEVLEKLNSI